MRLRGLSFSVAATALLVGCHSLPGAGTPPSGRLDGVVLLQWNKEDGFIYVPDPKDPLTYRLQGKPPIVPGRMFTDGGSIPRIFWGFQGYSPWAYGPAYMLHDWLYHQHRCKQETGYNFEEANAVLQDAINILAAQGKVDSNAPDVARSIRWAVDNFGHDAWNSGCVQAPPARFLNNSVTLARFTFGRAQ